MRPTPGLTARAVLERVIDGDTVDVSLLIPFRVRLLDCWAPELHGTDRDVGAMAKQMLQDLVPRGTRLIVQVPTGQADSADDVLSFGRVLGNVWREHDDLSLSEQMVATGLATKERL